ncbi:MAG TPA: PilZ domain-containing protein [Allosphingosinicella sp.]|nr:PilZ domain-containing protein [Allosphingosinicella sp.]
MGVEQFVDGPVAGKRQAKRARVLLAAKLQMANGGEIAARLRDLSRKGALVECQTVPPVGTELVFNRGSTSIPARVAWTGSDRVGLEFAYMIDEHEVLVQLKRTSGDQNQPRFRRPRLFGESMSHQEKQLARLWGASVGIAIPGE